MNRLWRKIVEGGRTAFVLMLVGSLFILPPAGADDGSKAQVNKPDLQQRIGAVFYRSMEHWRYHYSKIPPHKAGVACIPWARLDDAFLDNEIFEALGFSYSMASDESAIPVAAQGCEQMRAHYKLSDCNCELVLVGDTVVVEPPE
jgi:hypothetical protein